MDDFMAPSQTGKFPVRQGRTNQWDQKPSRAKVIYLFGGSAGPVGWLMGYICYTDCCLAAVLVPWVDLWGIRGTKISIFWYPGD